MTTVDVVSLTVVVIVGVKQKMDGRNNAALQAVAQAVQNQPNAGGNDRFRHLGKFQSNNPPTFKGRYDLDGAQTWLRKIERIFKVMDYSEVQKVQFDSHMLQEEADDLWINTRQVLGATIEVLT